MKYLIVILLFMASCNTVKKNHNKSNSQFILKDSVELHNNSKAYIAYTNSNSKIEIAEYGNNLLLNKGYMSNIWFFNDSTKMPSFISEYGALTDGFNFEKNVYYIFRIDLCDGYFKLYKYFEEVAYFDFSFYKIEPESIDIDKSDLDCE